MEQRAAPDGRPGSRLRGRPPRDVALGLWAGLVSQFVPTVGTYLAGALPAAAGGQALVSIHLHRYEVIATR